MKNPILTLLSLSALCLASCEDDEATVDVDAPVIVVGEPENGETFDAGGTIPFDANFEDNEELATYNIDIHSNFDEHAHGRLALTPFEYEQSFTLSGKMQDVHQDIDVSEDATAGPYHMTIHAIDAVGNSTTFADGSSKEIEIWLVNDEMARVYFEDADGAEVEEYEGEVDEALEFYGKIEDEFGLLNHVTIVAGHQEGDTGHDHEDSGRIDQDDDHLYEGSFEVEGSSSVFIQDLLAEANIVATQEYLATLEGDDRLHLMVIVEDEDGNISRYGIAIHFD